MEVGSGKIRDKHKVFSESFDLGRGPIFVMAGGVRIDV